MSSINTNLSAMTALQALKSTQTAMNKNQSQISTGLRVGEASDNASYWSIATSMKSDNGALSAVKDSIGQSKAMINTFTSAMDKTLTYLNKMKAGLVSARQPGADLQKIQGEFDAHIAGMKSAAGSAAFNGQNFLQGQGLSVELVTSYDGTSNSVGTLAIDTSLTTLVKTDAAGAVTTGGLLDDALAVDLTTAITDPDGTPGNGDESVTYATIDGFLADIDKAIADVTKGSAMLGANKALLETQEEFIGALSDSLTAGVSTFIDADMNEASTRNQALQTQQQLGVQALSMANQNSQMILKLFQ
jgi:flagellin